MSDILFSDTIKEFEITVQESERVVSKKEGIDFAREYGCLFIECSAKTRVNVEQCFEELVLKVRKINLFLVICLGLGLFAEGQIISLVSVNLLLNVLF